MRCVVDAGRDISEINESNNEARIIIEVVPEPALGKSIIKPEYLNLTPLDLILEDPDIKIRGPIEGVGAFNVALECVFRRIGPEPRLGYYIHTFIDNVRTYSDEINKTVKRLKLFQQTTLFPGQHVVHWEISKKEIGFFEESSYTNNSITANVNVEKN